MLVAVVGLCVLAVVCAIAALIVLLVTYWYVTLSVGLLVAYWLAKRHEIPAVQQPAEHTINTVENITFDGGTRHTTTKTIYTQEKSEAPKILSALINHL